MTEPRRIDVSGLPNVAFHHHAPIWHGQMLLAAIEAMTFALLIAAALYARMQFQVWPPPGANLPGLLLPTVELIVLLLSCIPMHSGDKAIIAGDWRKAIQGIIGNFILGCVYFGLRLAVWSQIEFSWNSHIYGSLVWAMLALHTTHVVVSLTETAVMTGYALAGHRENTLRQGFNVDEIYWYFVAVSGLLLYFVLHIFPRLA